MKDFRPIFDTVTNNNGWGASRIEFVFKRIEIPAIVGADAGGLPKGADAFIFEASDSARHREAV